MVEKISFFRSYYESIKDQDPATYKEALNALFAYVFDEQEINPDDLSPTARMFWTLTKPYVDTSLKKSANGKQGGSKSKANVKQNESKPEAEVKQSETNKKKNKKENKNIEVEVEGEEETHPHYHAYNADALEKQFTSPELAEQFGIWLDCRFADPSPYPPAAMADDLAKAKRYEQEQGAQAVIDVLKASLSYKRPVWDRLGRSQPKARSGTEDGTDYLLRRIAEEEAKEAQNDKNRSA